MSLPLFASPIRRASIPILIAMTFALTTSRVVSSQVARHLIRDPHDTVSCVVSVPAVRSATPDDDRLVIDIRVPSTPGALLLARLPANRRDYAHLPIRVFLVPVATNGQRPNLTLPHVRPVAGDLTPRPIPELPATDLFVRVEYARAHVRADVDVVAERTATANSGERVTSQTRCHIGAGDALLWR